MSRFDPDLHHRRSARLKGYDYSQPGWYFVTICVSGRAPLLGEIVEGVLTPSPAGSAVGRWWLSMPRTYANLLTDEFVVMPNHVHGVLRITPQMPVGADPRVRPGDASPGSENQGAHTGAPLPHRPANLITAVQWFKTMTTNDYIHQVNLNGWPPFESKLWQRSFYEHIIRSDEELEAVREYIRTNPARWESDRERL